MILPTLKNSKQTKTMTDVFFGYNSNLRCAEGELSEMINMSGEYYPVLSSRPPRGEVTQITAPEGLIGKDALIYIDGQNVVFNEYNINLGLSTDEEDNPKQLISMGAYLVIWPDKKYLNTADVSDYGNLGATYISQSGSTVTFSICKNDATEYTIQSISQTAPENPVNGDYWLDTSGDIHLLKTWSETSSMWISVTTTYVKIHVSGIGQSFNVNDGVKISGCTAAGTDILNNTMCIVSKADDYIVVIGIIDQVVTQQDQITVTRDIPDMEYLTESNNRIWGCHYGLKDGKACNELYACKLGDPKNWNCFMGISTDSYAVSLGSDGKFTGACTHLGYPLFFKANCIHKIYGSYPSNYQVQTTNCRGVQYGSSRSLQIVNEMLFYKSGTDICAYDGSLPQCISSALGHDRYFDAIAGSIGERYYISMKDSEGIRHLFVYDTENAIWHCEDNVNIMCFATMDERLYYIDATTKKLMCTTMYEGCTEEATYTWETATGMIGYDYPDNKYISRINLRMKMEVDATVEVLCEYDSSGNWLSQGNIEASVDAVRTFTLPVIPRRCDHMRIKIKGTGDVKIFSITKVFEEGSDM